MKRLLVIFSIILLSSCGGYKPIFKSQETNFYISKINNLSQDKISNQIKMKFLLHVVNSFYHTNMR